MSFRPSLRSIWTLLILAVVCCGLYVWCETSHVERKTPYYAEKMAAAELMAKALSAYQETTLEKGVFSETYKDPRLDAIIGQQYSLITTELGSFESKLVGANPNFAAAAVDLLAQAGVEKGDLVAVGFTGSHPGVNTAVLCACEALGAIPVTMASLGASWWGANDPEFTWPDMETVLNQRGIVHSRRIGVSYGGNNDQAIGLSEAGKEAMREAGRRNGLLFVDESSLRNSIDRRFDLFKKAANGNRYRAYVNVGDGIASLGHPDNGKLIRNGFNRRLPLQNYPARGVAHLFNEADVPVINIYDVAGIAKDYGLGGARVPLPQVGTGSVFFEDRYNLRVVGAAAAIAILLILVLVKLDAKLFKLSEAGVDPDTLM
jgi:poly-gamma-glutamate system protein